MSSRETSLQEVKEEPLDEEAPADGEAGHGEAVGEAHAHNHETFDLLQNDQAHIVEKKDGNIVVSKVSDYDVKERDNIKRIYRLGSLGGIPNTIDFNRIINNLL